jgi:hypothetical protein
MGVGPTGDGLKGSAYICSKADGGAGADAMRLQPNRPRGRGDEADVLLGDWLAEATRQHQPAVGPGRTQNRADRGVLLCQREQERSVFTVSVLLTTWLWHLLAGATG